MVVYYVKKKKNRLRNFFWEFIKMLSIDKYNI